MTITLNNESTQLQGQSLSVRNMLRAKGWSFPLIIVRVNGVLVERAQWDSSLVHDGDTVDALHLVSGG